jgi:hypothetical protein
MLVSKCLRFSDRLSPQAESLYIVYAAKKKQQESVQRTKTKLGCAPNASLPRVSSALIRIDAIAIGVLRTQNRKQICAGIDPN